MVMDVVVYVYAYVYVHSGFIGMDMTVVTHIGTDMCMIMT